MGARVGAEAAPAAQEAAQAGAWMLQRHELRGKLVAYESNVAKDAEFVLHPYRELRDMLGNEALAVRQQDYWQARAANRQFVQAAINDLPDVFQSFRATPSRQTMAIRGLGSPPERSVSADYGSIGQAMQHLLRDFSAFSDAVHDSTYMPVVEALRRFCPEGCDVMVPGAGLGRLALAVANGGFRVEANEFSRLFVTIADMFMNRPPPHKLQLFPLAHMFNENHSREQQYMDVHVPCDSFLDAASKAEFTMVPGDFLRLYRQGGPAHRKFGAVATCFFIDALDDIFDTIRVIDELLEVGGVWVNIGPLAWGGKARSKRSWEEIQGIWEKMGYEFLQQDRADCDYHLPRGLKMYTETYCCSLTTARKGPPPER